MNMSRSAIEWTDMTWNPVVGCTRVSAGCDNCYAIRQVHRMGHNPNAKIKAANAELTRYKERGLDWSGTVRCLPERLELPLRMKKPRRIFVNSLSDLFHEQVPDEFIDQVFAVMALAPQHTFQVLTKCMLRMLRYCLNRMDMVGPAFNLLVSLGHLSLSDSAVGVGFGSTQWPLPNVWLGVSVEDQKTADERIPLLLQTPAAVRFLSCEPLVGPIQFVDTRRWFPTHEVFAPPPKIDWVIVGGESGPGARPMHPNWVRSIRDQCQAAGVLFFFKQWGEWLTEAGISPDGPPHVKIKPAWMREDGVICEDILPHSQDAPAHHTWIKCARVGKKTAGRLLDGKIWDELAEPNGHGSFQHL